MRKEKGSIAIFVLVALLFMSAFLIISFASNVNKSKTLKEQFNIISGIYSYANGEEGAYDKAYSDLRNKNKQTMTTSSENSDTLELTKTFDENISNYRIYGNSVQNGTPTPDNPVEVKSVGEKTKNLLDTSKFVLGGITGEGKDFGSTSRMRTDFIEIDSNESYTIKTNTNFELYDYKAIHYYDENKTWISNVAIQNTFSTPNNAKYIKIVLQKKDISQSFTDEEVLNIQSSESQLEKGTMATDYEPYGKYKIPLKLTGSNVARINDGELGNIYRVIYGIPVKAGQEVTYIINYINNSNEPNHNLEPRLYSDESLSTLIKSYDTIASGSDIIKTITMTSDGYFTFCFGYGYKTIEFNKLFVGIGKFNIEDYQSYKEQTFNIILDEPLRKVGDYADYIDFKTGKVVRNIGVIENYNIENVYRVNTNTVRFGTYNAEILTRLDTKEILCESLPYKGEWLQDEEYAFKHDIGQYHFYLSFTKTRLGITDDDTNDTMKQKAKDYLSTLSNKKIYYPMQEVKEGSITLPQLKSFEDYTKIEVLTSVAPSKIEVEYMGYTLE